MAVHNSLIKDCDRALSLKGKNQALNIAELIDNFAQKPEAIICSKALRAKETADIISTKINTPITLDDKIYSGNQQDLEKIITLVNDEIESLLIIGHNPILEEFAALYNNSEWESTLQAGIMPASLLEFELDVENWCDFDNTTSKMTNLWKAKD